MTSRLRRALPLVATALLLASCDFVRPFERAMFYPDRGPWSDRWNGVGLAGKTRAQVLREYGLPVAITANQRGLLFSGSDLDQEPRIIVVFDEGGVVARSILVEHDAYAELRAAVADSQSKECSPAPASR